MEIEITERGVSFITADPAEAAALDVFEHDLVYRARKEAVAKLRKLGFVKASIALELKNANA